MNEVKRIGVMTSGGDAPGMNACIRAVVRTATYYGIETWGVRRGYEGMIENEMEELPSGDVGNILQRGGTMLRSARSKRFHEKEWRQKAFLHLKENKIDALVVIGGDGTFRGAHALYKDFKFPSVGVPGTIDNDLFGTDLTIGYDTALNTVIDAIDKIRDTADAHNRLFFVEVMGRDAGFIALRTGIAGGAESILIPEAKTNVNTLIRTLETGFRRKKQFGIVVVAEGDDEGGAFAIAEKVKEKFTSYDIRVSILGHIQRGGNPSCQDRVLASRLGKGAVDALVDKKHDVMIGIQNKNIVLTPFDKATKYHQEIDPELMHLAEILSS
ncbi:MAG: 6-phosphofructokinase [Chitinophagales bacterium]|nr:6-phosphofructokinase [Chitinophagales bacterium]